MAIIQSAIAATSGGNLIVDPTMQANRIAERPPEILGSYSMSQISGALTTVAAGTIAAPVAVFSFRWAPATSTQLCMIRRIEVGFNVITAFGTAQTLQYNLMMARSYTVSPSGGTAATFSNVNTAKHRTSMPPTAFTGGGDFRMASTAALTAGTVALDSQFAATVNGPVTALATNMPMTPLFQHQSGDYPLIFAVNEGFIINNGQLMGATGVVNLIVNVEWMELNATSGNAIAY